MRSASPGCAANVEVHKGELHTLRARSQHMRLSVHIAFLACEAVAWEVLFSKETRTGMKSRRSPATQRDMSIT